ncbi:hypothetical protein G9A89_000192 [Geosiphon pyriformis]|nr:hypothetical protein G9A89_000192 [Geosiphon pyriformis]
MAYMEELKEFRNSKKAGSLKKLKKRIIDEKNVDERRMKKWIEGKKFFSFENGVHSQINHCRRRMFGSQKNSKMNGEDAHLTNLKSFIDNTALVHALLETSLSQITSNQGFPIS